MASGREPAQVGAQLASARVRLTHARLPVPTLDAEILLAHVLGVTRERLRTHPEQRLTLAQRRRYQRLVERRAAAVPVAYLTGWKEFYGLRLRVTPRVLVPRPETELLVEQALSYLAQRPQASRVIDVGTGSGAIAVAIARACPRVHVEATDLSLAALRVARANVARHHLAARVRVRRRDLLAGAPRTDLVVANLPYLSERRRQTLPPDVHHEPVLALDGGPDGLRLVREAIRQAVNVLRPGGCLVLECDPGQAERLRRLGVRTWPSAAVTIHADLGGNPRVVKMIDAG